MTEFQNGIYLEVKKGTIGTGVTAKDAEYRNFWMTLTQEGDLVHCFLLDQDFKLTTIKDTLPVEDFVSGRLIYIPQGEKRYQKLLLQLSEGLKKKKASAPPGKKPAPDKKDPAKWWDQPEKEVNPGDLFKRDDRQSGKKPDNGMSSGNWWEGPKKDIQPGDIFNNPNDAKAKPAATPVKKVKKETTTKKSWWDK